MNTQVQIHESARSDFAAWVCSLGRTSEEQLGFADVYFSDILAQFRQHAGHPPGVTRLVPTIASVWVWEYQARLTWLLYQVKLAGGFWARLRGRCYLRVLILGFFTRPPTSEDLERAVRGSRSTRVQPLESPPDA